MRPAPALRLAPLVLVPVMLWASTFPGEFRVAPSYWVLAGSAAVVYTLGGRYPVAVALVLAVLAVPMFAAEAWGLSGLVPYLGAVALAEVAARADVDRLIAVAAAAWAMALLLGNWLDDRTSLWTALNVVTIAAGVGLPVLLGLYLRGQHRLAVSYQARLVDAESRRAATEVAVRAEERRVMARELHDLVAHHMASIVLRVGVAEHVVDGLDPRVAAVLDDVHCTAADALTDIRRLQDALRDPAATNVAMIERDAVLAEIDAAVERTRAAGFTITADVDPTIAGLDALARLTVLRVAQESLTNVMKHADATGPVELTVDRRNAGVAVRVSSPRAGRAASNAGGHGLIGMAERLDLVGGRLDVAPTDRQWVIDAWLPSRF